MVSEEASALQRLEKYLDYKKIAPAKLEKMAGLANGYIRKNKGSLSSVKLSDILSVLPDLNGDWLLTGRGEMLLVDTSTSQSTLEQSTVTTQGGPYFEQGRGAQHIGQMTGQGDNVGEKVEVECDHDRLTLVEENTDLPSLRKSLFNWKNHCATLTEEIAYLKKENEELHAELLEALRTVHHQGKELETLRKKR